LASFYEHIPVGHIEAGLRTNDIYSPWPEEINRQITGRISTYNFAPTQFGRNNLIKENVQENKIIVTGNTVIDALYYVVDKIKSDSTLSNELQTKILGMGYDMSRLSDGNRRMVLITGHRRENFGDGFRNICNALAFLSDKYQDVDFVYPMHLNPNVRGPINELFADNKRNNLFFIEPLDYFEFVLMMENSYIVLTDSGGVQEEAPGLGKPVLVMRDTTERPEAVEAGTVKLVGTDYNAIVEQMSLLLDSKDAYNTMSKAVNPYGDGKACERIVNYLANL
jgi:UDP-N-acetylglucosamine 2-epimerase (non-hydrolysing)